MTFGQRVFLKRKEKGLTQQQLSDLMGFTSRSSIYRIEEGKMIFLPPNFLCSQKCSTLHRPIFSDMKMKING